MTPSTEFKTEISTGIKTETKPDYALYLESARRAELADELRREGYAVEMDKSIDDVRFDLLAIRDRRTKAYEFRSVGTWKFDRESFRRVQMKARAEGFEFHIVIVNPPPRVNVEVDDLASQLRDRMTANLPENLNSLPAQVSVSGVYDLAISDIHVGKGEIRVGGDGTVNVELSYAMDFGGAPSESDSYRFHFKATLNALGHLSSVEELLVDTSTFYEHGDL